MNPRWMIEHVFANQEREILQTVIVYAENESKEVVKRENKHWTYRKELIGADYR